MTSDVVYIDLVNNKLLEKYYEWNIDTYPGHPSLHLYQYMLMEGSWKKWFEHTKFTERRQKCSKIMLSKFYEICFEWKILINQMNSLTNLKKTRQIQHDRIKHGQNYEC